MSTLKINGKEYKLKPTYGKFQKLFDKYDFSNMEGVSMKEANDIFCDCYWALLKRRWYGLKPFITKGNFLNNIPMAVLGDMAKNFSSLLTGEDRNLKNSD
jgi:hypothetical protein